MKPQGQRFGGRPSGPPAANGVYRVVLAVDGTELSQPVTIEGDPISYSLALQSSDRIDVLIGSRDRYSPMGTFAYVCTLHSGMNGSIIVQ